MNKIYIPTTRPEDWKPLLADPKHWAKGYSAMSLAYCWQLADGFPAPIQKVFSDSGIGLFSNIEMLLAIPEYQVPLPGGASPSQNDLFVLAKGDDQLISIMVEGKANEPFGDLVADWLKDASTGKKKRLINQLKQIWIKKFYTMDSFFFIKNGMFLIEQKHPSTYYLFNFASVVNLHYQS